MKDLLGLLKSQGQSDEFDSGDAVLQTSVEPGKEVKSNDAILFHSHNLIEWTEVIRFKKDILPMTFFKFGVISFAEGAQSSKDFILFGEGLVDLEGTTIRASID